MNCVGCGRHTNDMHIQRYTLTCTYNCIIIRSCGTMVIRNRLNQCDDSTVSTDTNHIRMYTTSMHMCTHGPFFFHTISHFAFTLRACICTHHFSLYPQRSSIHTHTHTHRPQRDFAFTLPYPQCSGINKHINILQFFFQCDSPVITFYLNTQNLESTVYSHTYLWSI